MTIASRFFAEGLKQIIDGTIDLDNDTLKVMLINNSFTVDPTITAVDTTVGDANDPSAQELNASNYTGGNGGASRLTATVTVVKDNAADKIEVRVGNQSWTNIGGVTNDTIGGGILIKEGGTDATSVPIAALGLNATTHPSGLPTNGGTANINWNEDENGDPLADGVLAINMSP